MPSVEERLLARRAIDPVTDCWNWTGADVENGARYGAILFNGRPHPVHRVAAMLWLGFDIKSKLYVLHHCDNTRCFNPAHLFIGTQTDNMADMYAKGRAPSRVGENHPGAKLTEDDVRSIRDRAASGEQLAKIAREYGLTPPTIGHVVHRVSWSHVD